MNMDYKRIESKSELISLITWLCSEDPERWENASAQAFLEEMASWLEDAEGFYNNFQLETSPETASWQLFADAIQAATIYE